MKKLMALMLAAALALSLAACGGGPGSGSNLSDEAKAIAVLQAAIKDLKSDGYTDFFGNSDHETKIVTTGKTSFVYTFLWLMASDGLRWTEIIGEYSGNDLVEVAAHPPKFRDDPGSTPEYDALFARYREATKQDGVVTTVLDMSSAWETAGAMPADDLLVHFGAELAQAYLIGLMHGLKNPYSIQVHSVWCWPMNENEYCFTVTISAENSLGGRVTSTYGNRMIYPLTVAGYKDTIQSKPFGTMFGIYDEDETYAQDQNAAILLDAAALQEYILANYK